MAIGNSKQNNIERFSKRAEDLFYLTDKLFSDDNNKSKDIWFNEHFPSVKDDPDVCFIWPLSALYTAFLELTRIKKSSIETKKYLQRFDNLIMEYKTCNRNLTAFAELPSYWGGKKRFYDDNEWLGLGFLRAYDITGDKKYIDNAIEIFSFLEDGMSELHGGGIFWCEQEKNMKNTCSNAPGALLAFRLYSIIKNEYYYDIGLKIYNWTKNNLQDTDGLYYDHIKNDGSIDKTKYTYNSGAMINCAIELFHIDNDIKHIKEADKIAKASYHKFFLSEVESSDVIKRDIVWFDTVLLRGLIDLYKVDKNFQYINYYIKKIDDIFEESMNSDGLINVGKNNSKDAWLLEQAGMIEMLSSLANLLEEEEF